MVKKFSRLPSNPDKSAKAQGNYLRVHFKNTHETAAVIKGMKLVRAKQFLNNVLDHKEAVPFRTFKDGPGRTAQAKNHQTTQARWPKKSVEFLQKILQNAEANAEAKGLDASKLVINHIQVQRAPHQRRRTYRAHGRINPYMSSPSHVELFVTEKTQAVAAPKADKKKKSSAADRLSNGGTA
eukprot:TRINITY_DN5681_c0_g1_i1.p1 TRINITY_DN5681_c0_g1~~TRINITY_DN5681_c0_g1_i1.p1  ORF type:complete len:182 (-),score=54.96 TRINITY_DN5681_c0_g1_i1:141-686(-)